MGTSLKNLSTLYAEFGLTLRESLRLYHLSLLSVKGSTLPIQYLNPIEKVELTSKLCLEVCREAMKKEEGAVNGGMVVWKP